MICNAAPSLPVNGSAKDTQTCIVCHVCGQLGHEVGGNEFAKLIEDGQRCLGWYVVFHQVYPEWGQPPATSFFKLALNEEN